MGYHMRRQDRELKSRDEIDEILNKGQFIVLSLCHDNQPYIVTLSYGYDRAQNCLYMHCANQGMKLDFIRQNSLVCATVIIDKGYIHNQCGHEYETVVLRGHLEFINSLEGKQFGIATILKHLESDPQLIMQKALKSDDIYKTITVMKLSISDITGKKGR